MPPKRKTQRIAIQPPETGVDKEDGYTKKSQAFEFVTITTKPDNQVVKSTSKQVRTHAMRDFLRKKQQKASTGIVETLAPKGEVAKPAEYKNKFKLDSWSHKTAAKAAKAKQAKEKENEKKSDESSSMVISTGNSTTGFRHPVLSPFAVSGSLDPFDSLAIKLEPLSQQLFYYYNSGYTMNSVAVNAEGNLFSFIKTDSGLFHALMYLVALHRDLRQTETDSAATLHHGSKAFGILNQRLIDPSGIFSDTTIAAVAMLLNKENLNGRYALSKMHFQGLHLMVEKRGGIQALPSVFQRVVTWSDFCFAGIWNIQPRFPRLHNNFIAEFSDPDLLKPSHLFGSASPIVPIFDGLRKLSVDLDSNHITTINRLQASTTIYNVEYNLLLLNKVLESDPEPIECVFWFEAIPLKTAAHIYLWIVIRELPAYSELLYRMVQRLKDSLEFQIPGWWNGLQERKMWLLWILFIGGVAANGRHERFWFVKEVAKVCQSLGIWSPEGLTETLTKVLWQEAFFGVRCVDMWRDVCLVNKVELHVAHLDII